MSNEVKKYNLTICGHVYTFMSDEPELAIMQAAQHVDSLMQQIAAKSPGASREKVAVFVAVRYALDYILTQNTHKANTTALQNIVELVNTVLQ